MALLFLLVEEDLKTTDDPLYSWIASSHERIPSPCLDSNPQWWRDSGLKSVTLTSWQWMSPPWVVPQLWVKYWVTGAKIALTALIDLYALNTLTDVQILVNLLFFARPSSIQHTVSTWNFIKLSYDNDNDFCIKLIFV
jgi:hypothetical protein